MNSCDRRANADRILYEFGLLKEVEKIGNAHIIGSYRMDMMAWNDLDLDIENDAMSLKKLHKLSAFIIDTFHPLWYEAKEEALPDGRKVWFHGFETMVTGELWNIDLWFFDKETILDAAHYCDAIAENTNPLQKEIIVSIKSELITRKLYAFDKYKSTDVYEAVLEKGVTNIDEFFALYN